MTGAVHFQVPNQPWNRRVLARDTLWPSRAMAGHEQYHIEEEVHTGDTDVQSLIAEAEGPLTAEESAALGPEVSLVECGSRAGPPAVLSSPALCLSLSLSRCRAVVISCQAPSRSPCALPLSPARRCSLRWTRCAAASAVPRRGGRWPTPSPSACAAASSSSTT